MYAIPTHAYAMGTVRYLLGSNCEPITLVPASTTTPW